MWRLRDDEDPDDETLENPYDPKAGDDDLLMMKP